MRRKYLNAAGDTLVEVMLSTVILSVVLAGAYRLTNTASRINQQAYERTRVSNYLQQQAEFLRSARDTTSPVWLDILNNRAQPVVPVVDCKAITDLSTIPTTKTNGFYLQPDVTGTDVEFFVNGSVEIPKVEDLFYIWVEVYDPSAGVPESYVDLYVNACWEGIGLTENQESGFVFRLERTTYD